jgi:hypothetical protein
MTCRPSWRSCGARSGDRANSSSDSEMRNACSTSESARKAIRNSRSQCPPPSYTDQIRIFTDGGERIPIYIEEYKAAHSLDVEYPLARLREMDPYEEVVNNLTMPGNDQAKLKFAHKAERLVATYLTQIFDLDYMVSRGLQYGCTSASHTPSSTLARSLAGIFI